VIVTKVRFQNPQSGAFHETLKQRVNQYFEEKKLSVHANRAMIVKTIVLLGAYFFCYGAIISGYFTLPVMWLYAIGMGIAMAGIGFSIAHDAIHGAYSENKKVNYLLGLTMNLIGGNRYTWNITHNIVHHTYTNIHEHDEDLKLAPFIRLSQHEPHRPIHRFQHYLTFVAYSLATIFWVFLKDYKKLSQKNIGPYQNRKHPKQEMIMLVLTKVAYYAYTIAVPLLVLDITIWQFLIGFFTMHLTAGIILGVIFSLAHVVENTEHPAGDENNKMPDSWAVHQMKTTNNFAMDNSIVNWYVGGLNFQVEHHLFPNICSIHYKNLSPIVQQTAQEFNVPYNYHNTLSDAIASHYRQLKYLGSNN